MNKLVLFFYGEKGQTLTEYVFILILIAVVIFLMVEGLGKTVNSGYSTVNCVIRH